MKIANIAILAIALFTVAFLLMYYKASSRYLPLTNAFHHANGSSAALDAGRISYQWHGNEQGEIVVLVHGFSTPKFVWQNNLAALTDSGYRVLTYDHFGRGHSDRPIVDYNRRFYIEELKQLLDHLDVSTPVTLVGYSMGGGNVTSFAAQYPSRVKQLILLAPAGFLEPYTGLPKLLTLPGIGKILLTLAGADQLMAEVSKAASDGAITTETVNEFKKQFYTQGTPHALSSTLRHYPMYNLSDDYKKVGQHGLHVTAIWGDADEVVPFSGSKPMRELVPQLTLHKITGARHDFTFTQADDVNPLILEALKHHD